MTMGKKTWKFWLMDLSLPRPLEENTHQVLNQCIERPHNNEMNMFISHFCALCVYVQARNYITNIEVGK
jgi:hypothetical protein